MPSARTSYDAAPAAKGAPGPRFRCSPESVLTRGSPDRAGAARVARRGMGNWGLATLPSAAVG